MQPQSIPIQYQFNQPNTLKPMTQFNPFQSSTLVACSWWSDWRKAATWDTKCIWSKACLGTASNQLPSSIRGQRVASMGVIGKNMFPGSLVNTRMATIHVHVQKWSHEYRSITTWDFPNCKISSVAQRCPCSTGDPHWDTGVVKPVGRLPLGCLWDTTILSTCSQLAPCYAGAAAATKSVPKRHLIPRRKKCCWIVVQLLTVPVCFAESQRSSALFVSQFCPLKMCLRESHDWRSPSSNISTRTQPFCWCHMISWRAQFGGNSHSYSQ